MVSVVPLNKPLGPGGGSMYLNLVETRPGTPGLVVRPYFLPTRSQTVRTKIARTGAGILLNRTGRSHSEVVKSAWPSFYENTAEGSKKDFQMEKSKL